MSPPFLSRKARKRWKKANGMSPEEVGRIFREAKIGNPKPILPDPDFSLEDLEKAKEAQEVLDNL